MIEQLHLERHLMEYLQVDAFKDYCLNGLQVEGSLEIKKVVVGVTASQALIDAAIQADADAIIVHHGLFWKGDSPAVRGMKRKRLMSLLEHRINLFAYHLPLDAHSKVGNNIRLGKQLSLQQLRGHVVDGIDGIVWTGAFTEAMPIKVLANDIECSLKRAPLVIGKNKDIRTIAWCTGAGQRYIEFAQTLGVDAFLSGEISEQTTHFALENNLSYFACGHHATERYGIQALGEHIAQEFQLDVQFIDIDNPV